MSSHCFQQLIFSFVKPTLSAEGVMFDKDEGFLFSSSSQNKQTFQSAIAFL